MERHSVRKPFHIEGKTRHAARGSVPYLDQVLAAAAAAAMDGV